MGWWMDGKAVLRTTEHCQKVVSNISVVMLNCMMLKFEDE